MTIRRILSLTLLFVLAACQSTSAKTATPSASATKTPSVTSTPDAAKQIDVPKEALKGVTIQVWNPWFGVEQNLFDSQVNEFNQTNEWGITVHSTSQSNYTQLFESVTTVLPTPDRPQIAIALPENALQWDSQGGLVTDLTDYVNDPQYGLTSDDVKDFAPVFWNQDSIGGKRLGIPAERSARFMLYNASWAHELGFDNAPQNADDFHQQACRAHQTMLSDSDKTNDNMGGWLVDTNPITLLSWMTSFGGGVLEGNDYRFLTPKNIDALTFVKQLYDDGCAWTLQPDGDPAAAFAGRKALFETVGLEDLSNMMRAMGTASNADKWTVMSFPGSIQPGLVVYGSSYIVLNSTPEKQLASWLFIRWMLQAQNQKKWVEVTGMFPLRNSEIDLLSDYKSGHPQWAAAVDLLPQAQIQPQLASWRTVRVMMGDGFDVMFRTNTAAGRVAEILAIMDSTAKDITK